MHGSSFSGDGAAALTALGDYYDMLLRTALRKGVELTHHSRLSQRALFISLFRKGVRGMAVEMMSGQDSARLTGQAKRAGFIGSADRK